MITVKFLPKELKLYVLNKLLLNQDWTADSKELIQLAYCGQCEFKRLLICKRHFYCYKHADSLDTLNLIPVIQKWLNEKDKDKTNPKRKRRNQTNPTKYIQC